MRVIFELAAAVREKAGVSRWEFELDATRISVLDALIGLENAFGEKQLRVVEGQKVRKDVLVFVKDRDGKQKKIVNPEETGYHTGTVILIASAMEGG